MLKQLIRALLIILPAMLLTACNENTLLENLTQQQANQVMAILQQHDISAQKRGGGKAGYTITVSLAENTAALSIINQYQLPWPADVQIEKAFPENALVASPNAEQARVLSLQEQRLEQSLRIIDQVVNAKVHISYPPFGNEISAKSVTEHVGVIITFKGDIDENLFITQIKSLIKNSLNNIRYENISVVLFSAPAIQYAPPTKAPPSALNQWLWLFIAIALCTLITGGYFIYKATRKPPRPHDSDTPHEEQGPA